MTTGIAETREDRVGRRIDVNTLDSMLERNKDFAAQQSAAGTLMPSLPRATPNVRALIIGCADMRVDPAHLPGIKPGEALVLRNIGARITPVLLEELGLLGRIGQVLGKNAGGGGEFHLIVLHPTDCGITAPRGRPRQTRALFSNTGRGSRDKSGHRSARCGCHRRRFAPRDSRLVGSMACLWPRL